jgi:hypothetical protein
VESTLTRLARVLLIAALVAVPASAGAWEVVTETDGIRVLKRQSPGRDFPTFRAIGVVDASVYQVLAVLADIARHPQWVSNCSEAKQLRQVSETEVVLYTRTDAPWPVSDRDAVFRSTAHVYQRGQHLVVRFVAAWDNAAPPRKGIVRMTNLRGHYVLKALGPQKMMIDYVVDADPAGSLPKWLAKLSVRKLPLDTIRALRKQVVKTQGWYAERIRKWLELEKTLPLARASR